MRKFTLLTMMTLLSLNTMARELLEASYSEPVVETRATSTEITATESTVATREVASTELAIVETRDNSLSTESLNLTSSLSSSTVTSLTATRDTTSTSTTPTRVPPSITIAQSLQTRTLASFSTDFTFEADAGNPSEIDGKIYGKSNQCLSCR